MSDAHSGGQYPGESEIKMNEYASLILTVSVPLERLIQYTLGQELSKLPVMTYIHGGACTYLSFSLTSIFSRESKSILTSYNNSHPRQD
jgi:hypothetical protein